MVFALLMTIAIVAVADAADAAAGDSVAMAAAAVAAGADVTCLEPAISQPLRAGRQRCRGGDYDCP